VWVAARGSTAFDERLTNTVKRIKVVQLQVYYLRSVKDDILRVL